MRPQALPRWLRSGLALAALVAVGILAWRELARRAETRVARARVAREIAAAGASAARERTRLEMLEGERGALPARANAATAVASPQVPPAKSPDTPPRTLNPLEQIEQQHRDPVMAALRLEAERAKINTRFAPLFRKLGLSAAQIAQFQDNLARCDAQVADIQGAANAQGLKDDDDAVAQLIGRVFEAYETAQRAVIGEEGLRAASEFNQTLVVRDSVSGVVGMATLQGVPFAPGQAERLVELLLRTGGRDENGRWRGFDAIDWAVADAEAATFLTADQIRILRTTTPQVPGGDSRFFTAFRTAIERAREADLKAGNGR